MPFWQPGHDQDIFVAKSHHDLTTFPVRAGFRQHFANDFPDVCESPVKLEKAGSLAKVRLAASWK